MLLYVEVPAANENALLILLGVLTKSLADVLNYFFGSSVGSPKKQAVIDRMLPGGEPPVPTGLRGVVVEGA